MSDLRGNRWFCAGVAFVAILFTVGTYWLIWWVFSKLPAPEVMP